MTDPKQKEIELEPDAWQRFERAVDVVSKSPPQPRTKPTPKKRRKKLSAVKTKPSL
jgi:hypothetical protein